MSSSPTVQDERLTVLTSGPSHFFGFHDLTPWDASSQKLICLRTSTSEDHVPTHNDEADVCIVDESSGSITRVGTTRAWNWQQASRQRWIPALGDNTIIYNDADDDGFCSRIVDLETGERRTLPNPVFDVSSDGAYALTVNFHRLHVCSPDYGYDHADAPETLPDYEEDGIYRLDLTNESTELLFSIADLLRHDDVGRGEGNHYFTHILISPDDRRFCFLHRCIHPSGSVTTNLVVMEADGSDVRVVAQDKVSHFDWRNSDRIIVWCRENAAIQKLKSSPLLKFARFLYGISRKIRSTSVRQSVYGESFREIDVHTGERSKIGTGVLTEDGHPQVHPEHSELWVNDTYPNDKHVQTLMLFNQKTNERRDLLRLPTNPAIQETRWRCDFHPRWAPNGLKVSFDSAHDGRRQLCVKDVSDHVDEMI